MQRTTMSKLVGLQFRLQYKKGHDNTVVDSLSRVAQHFELSATSAVLPIWVQEIFNSYAMDDEAQLLLQELALTNPNAQRLSLHEGLIRK
jgi:hypothetical protein